MFTARAKDKRAMAAATGLAGLFALALIGCSGGQAATPAKATAQTAKPGTEQSTTPEATAGASATTPETAAAVEAAQGPQATVEIKTVDASGHTVVMEMKTIYFDFDKYDIRPDQKAAVDFNAAELKKNPGVHVIIEGHCDERGTTEYNLALGQRRAVSVLTALESDSVTKDRMKTISYGKERPAIQGHDEAAWSKNRRGQFRMS
jgi:peptidoglycan-associated lipoprotein